MQKIFILLLSLIMLNACGEKDNSSKTLIIGTSADYPPFESLSDGVVVGFEIDLAKGFADEQKLELKVQDLDFSGLIAALTSNKVDMVFAGLTPNDERRKIVDFSDNYYDGFATLLTLKTSQVKQMDDLTKKKLGAQLGTVWEQMAKAAASSVPGLAIHALSKTNQLIEELKIGRIQAIIIDQQQAAEFVKAHPELTMHNIAKADTGYAAAFKKQDPLVAKFNQYIQKIQHNGELDKLKAKWF